VAIHVRVNIYRSLTIKLATFKGYLLRVLLILFRILVTFIILVYFLESSKGRAFFIIIFLGSISGGYINSIFFLVKCNLLLHEFHMNYNHSFKRQFFLVTLGCTKSTKACNKHIAKITKSYFYILPHLLLAYILGLLKWILENEMYGVWVTKNTKWGQELPPKPSCTTKVEAPCQCNLQILFDCYPNMCIHTIHTNFYCL